MLSTFREANVSDIIVISTSRDCLQAEYDQSLADRNIHFFRLCQTYQADKENEEMLSSYNVSDSESPGSFNEAVYKWYQYHVESPDYVAKKCNTSVGSVSEMIFCGYTFSRYNHRSNLKFAQI